MCFGMVSVKVLPFSCQFDITNRIHSVDGTVHFDKIYFNHLSRFK